jgi:hypothetical protein
LTQQDEADPFSGSAWAGFLAGIHQEFETRLEHLSNFTTHPLAIGIYREELLRELLKQYFTPQYHVGKGFLLTESRSSREHDILIAEASVGAVAFHYGGISVFASRVVKAAIEVKSQFKPGTFDDAVNMATNAEKHAPDCFTVAYFLTAPKNAFDTLQTWLDDPDNEGVQPPKLTCIADLGFVWRNDDSGECLLYESAGQTSVETLFRALYTALVLKDHRNPPKGPNCGAFRTAISYTPSKGAPPSR